MYTKKRFNHGHLVKMFIELGVQLDVEEEEYIYTYLYYIHS